MGERVLEVRDAAKSFESTTALDGAELTLERGEWLGLLGPNGAGKTTLVRAIAGRVRLDRGTVMLFGERVARGERATARLRRRLGIVPQEIALYPFLTARENLEVFGALAGLARPTLRERVSWALDFTDLRSRADDRTTGFSGGMKRRLNIACSVLHRPEVLLLDEPTVGVDPQSRERIWEMLSELRDAGASLMLTSHQLDEVERVCSRIMIIDHGRMIANGTVGELIAHTVGGDRSVTIMLDGVAPDRVPDGFELVEGSLRCRIGNVASELPALLERCAASGVEVADVHIEHPTLHAVFIHLTGRALRE